MRASALRAFAVCLLSTGISSFAAAQVSVGAGSTWSLGDAAVDFGCADLAVNGTLDVSSANVRNTDSVQINAGGTVNGGTGTLGLTGDFSNAGTFSKGTGTVSIADGCGNTTSTIAGSQSFSALSVTTTTGKTLLFTAGATTSVSPGLLTLQGAPGNLLKVRSTVPGTPAKLNLLGTQNIRYVDVADNHGTGLTLAPGLPSASNSVNSGNVFNWFDVLPIIPALSVAGLIVLSLLVIAYGLYGRRRTQLAAIASRTGR
jgi:hypothetical protein